MSKQKAIEVEASLGRLRTFQPDECAVDRALRSARETVSAQRVLRNRWRGPIVRIVLPTFGVATAAALVLVALWGMPSTSHGGMTFAEVIAAVQETHSVSFRAKIVSVARITDKTGKIDSRRSEHTYRECILDTRVARFETDRFITVTNPTTGKQLQLQPKTKEAYVLDFEKEQTIISLYDKLKNLKVDALKRVGERMIDGHKAVGFLDTDGGDHQSKGVVYWVDSETRLPLLAEYEVKDDKGDVIHSGIYDEFRFDAELDPALFNLTPPADYKLAKEPIVGYASEKGGSKQK